MRAKVLFAIASIIAGLILILVVPTCYEGPLLVSISEQHAIRLVDAIGLAVAIPSWLYLNVLLVRLRAKRRKAGNTGANVKQ